MRKNKTRGLLALMIAAGLACGLAATGGLLAGAGEFLVHSDEPTRGGAVVLLSGGEEERMEEAARLMRERYTDLLILTDTDRTMPMGGLEWEYLRIEMVERGVSPAQIQVTYHTVDNTRDEASAVREFLQRHAISSCMVVTDPFHTQRTRIIFQREMAGTGIEVRVIAARDHWYRAGSWFLSARGWRATLSEYIRLGYEFLPGN